MTATMTHRSASTAEPRHPTSFASAERALWARGLAYAAAALRHVLANVAFLVFTIALPVAMYLIFSGIYGGEKVAGNVTVAGVMMVTMAAYGGLGAALNGGFQIHEEQRSGWFRQLSLTGLPAPTLIAVRIVTASVVIAPAIAVLFTVAKFVEHVDLPGLTFLRAGLVLWAALVPMVLIGLALALWLPSAAGQAALTIVLMVLAVIGGLWFPIQMFPAWLQTVARFTPSYWIGELGIWAVVQDNAPWRGVLTLAAWSLVLAVVCVIGYRRAVRTSRR